jgi:hypothetical protein
LKKVPAIFAAILALVACGSSKHSSTSTTSTTSTTSVTIPIPTIPLETTTSVAAASTTTTSTSTSTSTTVAKTTTTTASTTGVVRTCATTDLAPLMTATDRASYTAGENVTITVSFKNHSTTLCQIARVTTVKILDPSGTVVHQQMFGDNFQGTTGRIKAGQTFTLTFGWDQTGCTVSAARCPAGGGYAVAANLNELSARAAIAIV